MKLHSRAIIEGGSEPFLARLEAPDAHAAAVRPHAALVRSPTEQVPLNAQVVVGFKSDTVAVSGAGAHVRVVLPDDLGYLQDGDIVRINPAAQQVRVIYRRASAYNALLVTERCNSSCLMCSQPPKDADDSFLVGEAVEAIGLMSGNTGELGLTGGEPTLLHDGLLRIIAAARDHLPQTSLHILSNGRLLAYSAYVERLADLAHQDLMIGVPLYSDLADRHDFVVQAQGAFDQTVRGIMNLGRFGMKIELRMVIHRQTFDRLPEFGAFVARNLPFVNQVVLMGLEPTGYSTLNMGSLWIDPVDYQHQLRQCVHLLDRAGIHTRIFNHQLCTIDPSLWPFTVQSISDWKNVFLPQCSDCTVRGQCGGLFSSAEGNHSMNILPVQCVPSESQ
jgi:His-Xaa-Ser system radical SAM maturase HxsC